MIAQLNFYQSCNFQGKGQCSDTQGRTCKKASTPKLLNALPKNIGVTLPNMMSSLLGMSPRTWWGIKGKDTETFCHQQSV
jgi:hypothetical protein